MEKVKVYFSSLYYHCWFITTQTSLTGKIVTDGSNHLIRV